MATGLNSSGSAIVFGGGSGLGAAAARRLAELGLRVVVADLSAEGAAGVAADFGGTSFECDVADEAAVGTAVSAAAEAPGGLRVLVNCAGIATPGKLVGRDGATPLGRFSQVIEVNLVGTINTLRLAAAAMAANEPDPHGQRGVCVNTASIAAFDGQIGQIAYAASKGGVAGLTLPAARELASHGIRVVTIAPGIFETPMLAGLPEQTRQALGENVPFPPRLGDPAEYAELVAHVVANPMLNGETIRLDGALRMPPR
jgi:NAD(P)-dependent dehydrogenase (short-subunit alcohol dehydrogenase family)